MFFISLIIRVPPSRGVHCRLDVLENDKKPNFQENIPGKVRFKKKWGAMATRPPIPPLPSKKIVTLKMYGNLPLKHPWWIPL